VVRAPGFGGNAPTAGDDVLTFGPFAPGDLDEVHRVINDAAGAYKGVIPADRWHEPYMPRHELQGEIEHGVRFTCCRDGDALVGVMGVQDKGEVLLVRHAYVATARRGSGIGTALLRELTRGQEKPILVGTWKAATWAIHFYENNGFHVVPARDAEALLRRFWDIPRRQLETSVVLADEKYAGARQHLLAGGLE